MSPQKSQAEAKVERFTWFLMVLVFAVIYFIDPETADFLPKFIIPLSGAIILLGSGMYQYMHRWHVSPTTWIGGTILVLLAMINLSVNPDQNFYGVTLLIFAAVIGVGILTGET